MEAKDKYGQSTAISPYIGDPLLANDVEIVKKKNSFKYLESIIASGLRPSRIRQARKANNHVQLDFVKTEILPSKIKIVKPIFKAIF